MKKKTMCFVLHLVVFALAAIGFSLSPRSVPGAGAEEAAVSPTDTSTKDTGTEGTENTYYGNLAGMAIPAIG